MKEIYLFILVFSMLVPLAEIDAQGTTSSGIKSEQAQITRDGDNIQIALRINIENINLDSQEMIILTPMAITADSVVILTFEPIVITGSKRRKALDRALKFGTYKFPTSPQLIVSKDSEQYIPLNLTLPYNQWMHGSTLAFQEEKIGCACEKGYADNYGVAQILPPLFNPEYIVSYVTPAAEDIKRRSDTYNARLNFKVNRFEILQDFENNRQVLSEVAKIIEEVQDDPNLTVSEFLITGYASPEGNSEYNTTLSENRAKSFVSYLSNNHSIAPSTIQIDWKGEDWQGLRNIVAKLNITDQQEILDIIDNETDIQVRKNKLKQLSGGETYRMLLHDYYPPLRRNEYTISYVARSFSLDEAKEQIKNKPQYLSLNEMYFVANSYPKNSEEFKHVFETATRIYPSDPVARLNSAALSLENSNIDTAIKELEAIDLPEAWNNLGVAYIQKKEYQKANIYFDKAANAGLDIATYNAEQLSKWFVTQKIIE